MLTNQEGTTGAGWSPSGQGYFWEGADSCQLGHPNSTGSIPGRAWLWWLGLVGNTEEWWLHMWTVCLNSVGFEGALLRCKKSTAQDPVVKRWFLKVQVMLNKLSADLYLLPPVRSIYMALGLKILCMGRSCQPMVKTPSVGVLLGWDLRAMLSRSNRRSSQQGTKVKLNWFGRVLSGKGCCTTAQESDYCFVFLHSSEGLLQNISLRSYFLPLLFI